MVNHGLAAKLTATDLLLLRSLGRLFSYKKFISLLSARSFWNNVILTLHVQLDNTRHNLYSSLSTRNDQV